MFTANELWGSVLSDIQTKINSQSFNQWFKETKSLNFDGNSLTVIVQDDVVQRHISTTYMGMITNILLNLTGESIICNFIIDNANQQIQPSEKDKQLKKEKTEKEPGVDLFTYTAQLNNPLDYNNESKFNPFYVFDTFVVGPNNQLAHAAAKSVSQSPATNYNPLFLYGDSGLGKTHLLQAIGHHIMKDRPELKVLYVTSEQFINEFINSIMNKKTDNFKMRYRNVDILLIDDIQFVTGKEGTQEEFFHTFNELHGKNKQIVLTCDRPPKEIAQLTDRLRTRFMGGLIADIQAPNLETREAILRSKAEREGINIPDEVIFYVANRIKSNIRALESALKKLHVVSQVQNQAITIEMAKLNLKALFEEQHNKQITIQDIITKVCEKMGASSDMMVSKSRHNSIILPRFIAIYLSTQMTNLTTIEIGKEFGNRDHSTVINARNNIEEYIKNDESLKDLIDDIVSELKS